MKQSHLLSIAGASFAVANPYQVPKHPNLNGQPLNGFVSYSIEFASFPEFAGNHSSPNIFSDNLLNNLKALSGTKPLIRVGGNTQDYALFNVSQPTALVGIVDPSRSPDYPTTIHIGPSYFESYDSWPGTKFSHGLNMGLGGNRSEGWQTLLDTVPLVCAALSHGKLYTWEYGNEPDLFSTSAQGPVRPPTWDEARYVRQWHNATSAIRKVMRKHCPEMVAAGEPEFMAPSFAGITNTLKAAPTWNNGLNRDHDISFYSTHNYISGAESPGVTLQGTLMNHAMTKRSVDAHIVEYNSVFPTDSKKRRAPPLIFGETNSLYNQGRPGLSNTFGAALWGLDFNLYSASVGFKRVHMHQGTNYRYQAWQPVETKLATIGTKAPYYGSIAVAAMLKNTARRPVAISAVPLSDDTREAAYAAHYTSGRGSHSRGSLARLMVINMHSYNTTVDGAGTEPLPHPDERQKRHYTFAVDGVRDGHRVAVQRLLANGSDAITGITFDGWSYNYDLDLGKPVKLNNVTTGEVAVVRKGTVSVHVPDSSAVLLNFGQKC